MRKVHLATALGAAALTTVLAACSGGSPQSTPTSPAAAPSASGTTVNGSTGATRAEIVISNFKFTAGVAVKPGEKVTVVNRDSAPHTVTATSGHAFDTGNISGGKTTTFTAPTRPGDYSYICTIHQFMHGTLTVR